MRSLILFVLLLFPALASGQSFSPYLQVGVAGARNSGYDAPYPTVSTGVEYQNGRFFTQGSANFGFDVHKDKLGAGYSEGGTGGSYYQVYKNLSVGGGLSYEYLRTPAWSKSSTSVDVGGIVWLKSGRLYFDYLKAVVDQNHEQTGLFSAEIGRHWVRPFFQIGISRYSEPSFCRSVCTVYTGAWYAGGVKFMFPVR